MSRRVSYQGEPGAYSDVAMQQHFGDDAIGVPCHTFAGALASVIAGRSVAAIVPVENAIAGPVHTALDAITELGDQLTRVTEHRLTIVLCMLGLPGATLDTLTSVRSHPVALAQCRIFLARNGWLNVEPHEDTAGAAREVSEVRDAAIGAIASELAAARYGLEVLARGVQDVPHNWTRFAVLVRHDHPDAVRLTRTAVPPGTTQ